MVALVVIIVGKFTQGAWMVVIAIPLLVWLLLRIQQTYGRELSQLKVQASQRLAPPKPRHEVVVLIEDLDQAALSALQYARQLNPLSITAMHVAVDPDHARELGRLWSRVQIPFPWSWSTPPTATCWPPWRKPSPSASAPTPRSPSWPRRRYVGFWRRVLHDQTSAGLTKVLGSMENVNVTIACSTSGAARSCSWSKACERVQGDLMAMNSLVSSPLRRSSPGTRWSPRRRGRGAPALDQVGLGGQEHLGEGRDPLLGLLGGVVGGLADEGRRAREVQRDHRGDQPVVVDHLGVVGQQVVVADAGPQLDPEHEPLGPFAGLVDGVLDPVEVLGGQALPQLVLGHVPSTKRHTSASRLTRISSVEVAVRKP